MKAVEPAPFPVNNMLPGEISQQSLVIQELENFVNGNEALSTQQTQQEIDPRPAGQLPAPETTNEVGQVEPTTAQTPVYNYACGMCDRKFTSLRAHIKHSWYHKA